MSGAAPSAGDSMSSIGRGTYWGRSFIADRAGRVVAEAGEHEATITAQFDIAEDRRARDQWAVFRDRRPDLYGPLLTKDGIIP